MKLITVHMPEQILRDIEELIAMDIFPNRSEAIRVFVKAGIKQEYDLRDKIKKRSKYFEFYKKALEGKKYINPKSVVLSYMEEHLGINTVSNGFYDKKLYLELSNKFKIITRALSFKGFLRKHSATNYEVIR